MSQDFLTVPPADFTSLGLIEPLLHALDTAGYQEPTPIQARMIPHMLAGRDVIGQAQTGTGKTAAFALPLLNQLQPGKKARPTILVLAPTRELALQVSESFTQYGANLRHLRVLPIFGGQDYVGQFQQLERGVHIIVGTPGRVMDHIRRGSLKLDAIRSIILDEADEMLRMGFLEDVEWILEQAPRERQIALFSATMPPSIRRIAANHLHDPVEITIEQRTATAPTISQHFLLTRNMENKKEALARILAAEEINGVLVFVRTKALSVELSDHLANFGHVVTALNGDLAQSLRLRTVEQLKEGKLDILIATDVAARGLDVERVSHVINFDIPFDTESYIHRIGRTGRAGRSGKAILFLTPRERPMLKKIEQATGQRIEAMTMPTVADINQRRIASFKSTITRTLATDCTLFSSLITDYCQETGTDPQQVAAALAKMAQGKTPLLLKEDPRQEERYAPRQKESTRKGEERTVRRDKSAAPAKGMDRYRIELGEVHGVRPGNIVGAIANEADIDSSYIGPISIFEDYSTVDLPYGMPYQVLKVLQRARINGKAMRTRKETAQHTEPLEKLQSTKKPGPKTANVPAKGGKKTKRAKTKQARMAEAN